MKTFLLSLTFICASFFTYSQCTPLTATQCPDPENNGEICPDWIIATETVPYNGSITILPPPTANGGAIGTVDINWIQITAINNIPSGMSYACNPSNCQFAHATYNCIAMTGTPPLGAAGSYKLDIVLDANVTMESFPYITTTQSGQHDSLRVYCAKNENEHINLGNDTTILPSVNLTYTIDTTRYIAIYWNDIIYSKQFTFHGSIGNGVYSVSVLALDTLTWKWATDTVIVTVSPNVGINSYHANKNISFYPNPTNGVVNIKFDENSTSSYNVELFDLNNQLVSKNIINVKGKSTKTIDISDKPKGVYYLKVSNQKSFKTGKIVLM